MSEATELARAEADAVQAEEAAEDEETPDDETPETEPTPEPEPEPIDSVKLTKALDREADRHEKAVQKIMGEDFDQLARCALCAMSPAGYVFPFEALPPEAQDAIREGVNQYVSGGGIDLERFQFAADMRECEVCQGEGLVRSGSKHEAHLLEVCNPCTGNGWKRVEAVLAPVATLPPAPVAPAAPNDAPYRDAQGQPCWVQPDTAGRLYGDPNYGLPALHPGAAG